MRRDAELVEAARVGDRAAFTVLLGRHRGRALSLCERMLRDHAGAQDAVQEAAVTAWLELDRLRDPAAFGPWLAGIALNVCRGWLRYQAREVCSPVALAGGRDSAAMDRGAASDPSQLVVEHELTAALHDAIAQLPAGQQAAVVHYYLQGLTQVEAAAALGTSPEAIKTRLAKARSALRRRLLTLVEEPVMSMTSAVPVTIAEVAVLQPNEQGVIPHVVVLVEVDGERVLPIWIGGYEAAHLALVLEQVETPRPMTPATTLALLEAAGASVSGTTLTRLDETIYYAQIELDTPVGPVTVDARPSDALTLASLAGAPIAVDPSLLAPATTQELQQALEQAQARGTGAIVQALQAGWEQPTGS